MQDITANEKAVLLAITHNDYRDSSAHAETWAWAINDSSKPSGITGKALSGVCASLVKKGLAITNGRGDDASIRLTAKGIELAQEHAR